MNAYQAILPVLQEWGSHPVFIEVNASGVTTYTGADDLITQVQEKIRQFHTYGIRRWHRVLLFLDNSTDFIRVFFALLDMGAIAVPVNPAYRATELKEIFANAQPNAVISEQRYLNLLANQTEKPAIVLRSPRGVFLHREGTAEPGADTEPWLASINYTYRGYGYPLGAMLPHDQYIAGAHALQEGLLGRAKEKMLVILPMSHIFTLVGCLFVPLLYRMTAVILQSIHPRLVFECLSRHNIDYITAVPEVLTLLTRVKEQEWAFPSLKAFVCGGSRLDEDTYHRVRESFNVELMHGYGLTEFAPVSRNIRGSSRAGTIGPVCRGVRLKLGSGAEQGEAWIRTEHMARGYYRRPAEGAEAFVEGWFKSGDLLALRGEHLVFLRELKNTCKVNGSIVDLEEVRKTMLSFPGVEEAQTRYQDGQLWAEVGFRAPASDNEPVRLKEFLRGRIAGYKIPKRIVVKEPHGRFG